jgi:hypothetical protein
VADLTISDRRVDELQDALLKGLAAQERVKRLMRDLAAVDEALDRSNEAIYNATYYDPAATRNG